MTLTPTQRRGKVLTTVRQIDEQAQLRYSDPVRMAFMRQLTESDTVTCDDDGTVRIHGAPLEQCGVAYAFRRAPTPDVELTDAAKEALVTADLQRLGLSLNHNRRDPRVKATEPTKRPINFDDPAELVLLDLQQDHVIDDIGIFKTTKRPFDMSNPAEAVLADFERLGIDPYSL